MNFHHMHKNYELLIIIILMVIIFYPILLIFRKLIALIIKKIFKNKGLEYDKILEKNHLYSRLTQIFIVLYLIMCSALFEKSLNSVIAILIKNSIVQLYIITTLTIVIITFINIGVDIYNKKSLSKQLPINLHAQILKIIVFSCSGLSILSVILGLSISALFTSLGAAAALLTFVFKDTFSAIIASLQITFQDIIRVGDSVTLSKYTIDGDVKKITISTVVIKNFDGTTTTVPTSVFLTDSVKNWRPMLDKGGRRIKRALNLDIDSIRICSEEELNYIFNISCMKDFVAKNSGLFDKVNEISNLTMFRYYVNNYLIANQDIHKESFTFLVRCLDSTPYGLPIEVYMFTKNTAWVNYENIQSNMFEHLLGILPKFGLKAFQVRI